MGIKERDEYIIAKIKASKLKTSKDLQKSPVERERLGIEHDAHYLKWLAEKQAKEQAELEQELTDEEYDNIYYSQEDDTVDETYDGDYNPYGSGMLTETSYTTKALSKRQNEEYDIPMPEDFDCWSGYAKGAWLKKHTIRKED